MLATATPPNPCKPPISHTGAGNLGIGIGIDGSVTVPNKCDVLSNGILHVDPGHFPVSRFGAPNATSTLVDFSISLSDYAASAKPTLSFHDKAAQPNAYKTLL
ncbi:fimbrial protein [Burkholderia cepacia]|uniref:hypothetical protein n=1 Tax=Burkholderia cepacia TaxID=292 RepID=UPI0007531970|nr:hypothetical protein [Burkholderia cepacia]KVS23987.1 hypothetical protein WK36_34905 [Burkholderia cepacia]MCA8118349.1 fimbrial protein [Burkholderia cepacia]